MPKLTAKLSEETMHRQARIYTVQALSNGHSHENRDISLLCMSVVEHVKYREIKLNVMYVMKKFVFENFRSPDDREMRELRS
jgi:hypothetical protein